MTFSNSEGRFEIYNTRMKEITGYTMEEANRASDFSKLLYPDPAERQKALDGLQELKTMRGARKTETEIVTKSGARKQLRVVSRYLRFGNRMMYLTTYHELVPPRRQETANPPPPAEPV